MSRIALSAAATLCLSLGAAHAETLAGLAYADAVRNSPEMAPVDAYKISGKADLMALAARNHDGTVKAIVEIPAGTSAKWEISKDDPHAVYWELKKGAPRIVDYLGYPGNYGAIPGTALPKELGGDGDPLDVLVLGQAAPRGEVVDIRVIGALKLLDDGEQDDKLIAVMTKDSPFSEIKSLAELDQNFKGVTEIIATWFANYKGANGGMETKGFVDAAEANAILDTAIKSFAAK